MFNIRKLETLKSVLLVAVIALSVTFGPQAEAASPAVAKLIKEARESEVLYKLAIAKVVPAYVMIAGGSGVVITPDGLMLTNDHVIRRGYAKGKILDWSVRVGSKFYKADILGTDPHGDIALLQIKGLNKQVLPHVEFSNSDQLITGQQVIAIGNPFGTMNGVGDPTVTMGVISCLHRFQGSYSDAIQTDAPINPGNSGGPLLTIDGKLAGINGRIQAKHGARANTGIGLAIPANQIKRFLPSLKSAGGGVVYHAELRGLKGDSTEADGIQNGAEIKEVLENTPAAKMGLQAGDRITHVDSMPILNFARLLGVVGTYPGGSEVSIKFDRNGKSQTVAAKLERLDRGVLGFSVTANFGNGRAAMFKKMVELRRNPNMKLPAIVKEIAPNQPAAKSGLKKGDQIVAVDGHPILNPTKFMEYMRKQTQDGRNMPGEKFEFKILRGGKEQVVTVALGSQVAAMEAQAKKNSKGGKSKS